MGFNVFHCSTTKCVAKVQRMNLWQCGLKKLDLSRLHENQAEMQEAAMPSWPLSACNRPGKLVYSYFLVHYGVIGNQFNVVHNIKKKEGQRERERFEACSYFSP